MLDLSLKYHHHFLALAGKNPQIVTEALYLLMVEEKVNIEELSLITSEDCREVVWSSLSREIAAMCEQYRLNQPSFSRDNMYCGSESFAGGKGDSNLTNIIFDRIKTITSDDSTAMHLLISGGRKTMSFDAVSALNIYARSQDRAYHILASSDFERSGKFFPSNPQEAKELTLVNKPFLRFRKKLPEYTMMNIADIDALFTETQRQVNSLLPFEDLSLNISERTIYIGKTELRLPPMQFAIYLFFFRQKHFVRGGKNISRTNSKAIMSAYRSISPSKGQADRVFRTTFHNEIIDFDVVQKAISSIAAKIRTILKNNALAEFYIIAPEGSYADKYYGIRLPREKRKIIK